MIKGISASLSALQAESLRMQSSAHNTANANTDGFQRQVVTNQEVRPGAGVEALVTIDESPGSPLVDAYGDIVGESSNVDGSDGGIAQAHVACRAPRRTLCRRHATTVPTAPTPVHSLPSCSRDPRPSHLGCRADTATDSLGGWSPSLRGTRRSASADVAVAVSARRRRRQ